LANRLQNPPVIDVLDLVSVCPVGEDDVDVDDRSLSRLSIDRLPVSSWTSSTLVVLRSAGVAAVMVGDVAAKNGLRTTRPRWFDTVCDGIVAVVV
jgi:hypothetical protein